MTSLFRRFLLIHDSRTRPRYFFASGWRFVPSIFFSLSCEHRSPRLGFLGRNWVFVNTNVPLSRRLQWRRSKAVRGTSLTPLGCSPGACVGSGSGCSEAFQSPDDPLCPGATVNLPILSGSDGHHLGRQAAKGCTTRGPLMQ